jgi:hypothetical protein
VPVAVTEAHRPAYRPPTQYAPPRNGPCLCGSGLKYKRCCADRLPGHGHLGERMHAFLKEAKYKEALYASRADVSQYTIWHKSHTEPAIRGGMPKEGSILEIDIRALADCVDRLMFCHIKADMMDEFPAVLERLPETHRCSRSRSIRELARIRST